MATPTAAETSLVNQLFAIADPQKLNIITGEAALKVFTGTKLSPTQLGEIWQIADSDQNGFLTKKSAVLALRLIGHAQKGESITAALVNKRRSFLQKSCLVST
jgi:epidermal growth factor receptor substrate 15